MDKEDLGFCGFIIGMLWDIFLIILIVLLCEIAEYHSLGLKVFIVNNFVKALLIVIIVIVVILIIFYMGFYGQEKDIKRIIKMIEGG